MAEPLALHVFPIAALDLPEPARSYLRAGDEKRLAAEFAANYDKYHELFAATAARAREQMHALAPPLAPHPGVLRRPPILENVADGADIGARHEAVVSAGAAHQAALNAELLARCATAEGFALERIAADRRVLHGPDGLLLHRDDATKLPTTPVTTTPTLPFEPQPTAATPNTP